MIILYGPSACGKTEVAKLLASSYSIKKVITHTTRSKRINEVNGFLGKYLGMILVGTILVLLVLGAVYYLYKIGKI